MIDGGLWKIIRAPLMAFGHIERIENSLGLGVPDTCFILTFRDKSSSGWLELKSVPKPPVRPQTPFRIKSLTKDQVLWQEKWWKAGGRVYTLVRVGKDLFILLDPPTLRPINSGLLTLEEVLKRSRHQKGFRVAELVQWLIE